MDRRPTKQEAEDQLREFEQALAQLLRSVSPEEFIHGATSRLRLGIVDRSLYGTYPPHAITHAIEACCAYGIHEESYLTTEDYLLRVINTLKTFNDPELLRTLGPDSDLFDFILYVHRTQLEKQNEISWMPVGRMTRLFGDPSEVPICNSDFSRRFGITLRQWLQLAFAVHSATVGDKAKFTREYAMHFSELGIDSTVSDRFLQEISLPPTEIGSRYLAIRKQSNPRTWFQHRSQFAHFPLIAFPRGYVAPVEAYVADLFGDSLFRRLVSENSEPIRREVGRRYEKYIETVLRHHLPTSRIWTSQELLVQGGKSVDFVIDLPESVLLIECKAVIFERQIVTRDAVLGSTAINRVIQGYKQIVRTAERIQTDTYAHLGINVSKPRYGVVAALGTIPGANHRAVLSHAETALKKYGETWKTNPGLLQAPPQAFHGFAIEYLAICLRHALGTVPSLFIERANQPPMTVGDWQQELSKKLQFDERPDISFWKDPGWSLLDELGTEPGMLKPT